MLSVYAPVQHARATDRDKVEFEKQFDQDLEKVVDGPCKGLGAPFGPPQRRIVVWIVFDGLDIGLPRHPIGALVPVDDSPRGIQDECGVEGGVVREAHRIVRYE